MKRDDWKDHIGFFNIEIIKLLIVSFTYMTANCLSRGPCLIFMPRIDLWALETHEDQTLEHDNTHPTDEQCIRKAIVHRASSAWTLFIYQVESLSLCTPVIFLVFN